MPLENQNCDSCGENRKVCPECGDHKVTPLEPKDFWREELSAGPSVKKFVQYAEDGESLTFSNLCWECGWEEQITVTVER